MKSFELSEPEQWVLTYRHNRPLHSYIYRLDLAKWGIELRTALDVRNYVAGYTTYTPDRFQYEKGDHWPMSVEDVERILLTGRDDCDGLAILYCSIMHSLGREDVRLSLGGYCSNVVNHAWAMIWNSGNPLLVETTGDDRVDRLPFLADKAEYKLMYSASAYERKTWRHI